MRKLLLLSLALTAATAGYAQEPENWNGVDVIPGFYGFKMSHDGVQIVGDAEDGSTVYYNRVTKTAYYYEGCDFGRGYVVSDAGMIVGTRLIDSDDMSNQAVVMQDGKWYTPNVLQGFVTSNIHSITPDGSRICGVVGRGMGPTNEPFYCDIDAEGNFGQIQYLPTPPKDLLGATPMYCTANWMSADGKTIAGQVVEGRGVLLYPIIYTQDSQGSWSYSLPAEHLFNPEGYDLPKPVGEFEDEFPGVEYPDVMKYISPDKMSLWDEYYNKWETNGFDEEYDPYSHLDLFLTAENLEKYLEATIAYDNALLEYSDMITEYWEEVDRIADTSVFFVRNAAALSMDGKWYASSGEVFASGNDIEGYFYNWVPYLFNLETGEYMEIGSREATLVTNEVTTDGNVICATPAGGALPPVSYIYLNEKDEIMSLYGYVNSLNSEYGAWMEEYLTGDVQVGETDYERATVTGTAEASNDLSVISAGVMASALGYGGYFMTYILDDLSAGVEELQIDPTVDGLYRVYNLQGVKVLETKDPSVVNSLGKGLYIINGKKVLL